MELREEVRPEAEIRGLVEPLVDEEAGDPGRDHPRPYGRPGEDVVVRVPAAPSKPIGDENTEERHEEGAEEVEELRVLRQVEGERAAGRDRRGADDQ